MPPEQDETRARQIEALRHYITQLSEQREDPKEIGMRLPDMTAQQPRRPPLSWLLVTVLLVAVALVGGVFVGASAWSDDRPSASGAGTTAAPTTQTPRAAPLVATPDCKTAVDRANTALTVAVRMRTALAQGGSVASADPASFDRALAAYREVVDRCTLRAP